MKLSSVILLTTFTLLVVGLFASNILLKKEYDKIDKTDIDWTYGKILKQPFKHLKIEGGNITNIAFDENIKCSVGVLKNWEGYENKVVKTVVKNDTLFIKFILNTTDPGEKEYLRRITLVRIFAPKLMSIDGFNTRLVLNKFKQKNLSVHLSGRSKLQVESYINDFDSLNISQKDSSEVVFEMSPDTRVTPSRLSQNITQERTNGTQVKITTNAASPPATVKSNSWETIHVNAVNAHISGVSILDLGHAQINSLKLQVADTSSIVLSGEGINQLKK